MHERRKLFEIASVLPESNFQLRVKSNTGMIWSYFTTLCIWSTGATFSTNQIQN